MQGLKTGGRKKGSLNKDKNQARELFKRFTLKNFNEFEATWHILPPEHRCKTYLDVAKFVLPALSSVELNDVSEKSEFQEMIIELRKERGGK